MHCLVVGAGQVGLRKIKGLLDPRPSQINVVDPAPASLELTRILASHPRIFYQQRPFIQEDLTGAHLVFACTSRPELNQEIGKACAQQGLLCNLADNPEGSTFVLPATVAQGDLTIAVSTNGASPALSRIIRQDLEQRYGPEYANFTTLLRHVRTALLALGWPSSQNKIIFRKLATSNLPQLIKANNQEQCRQLLQSLLPDPLHPRIGEWCNDCIQTF